MVIVPEREPPRVPTREELYNLALIYLIASALSMICWAGTDILNHTVFDATLDVDSKIKPLLLIAFVFCLGMAISFYHKGRVTLFVTPPKEEKITIKLAPKSTFTKETYLKNIESQQTENPSDPDPQS